MSNGDTRTWSLSHELGAIEDSLRGIAILLDGVAEGVGDELLAMEIATAVVAILTILHLRLREIGRVLRGEIDPVLLHAAHNDASRENEHINRGEDVVFGARAREPTSGSTTQTKKSSAPRRSRG